MLGFIVLDQPEHAKAAALRVMEAVPAAWTTTVRAHHRIVVYHPLTLHQDPLALEARLQLLTPLMPLLEVQEVMQAQVDLRLLEARCGSEQYEQQQDVSQVVGRMVHSIALGWRTQFPDPKFHPPQVWERLVAAREICTGKLISAVESSMRTLVEPTAMSSMFRELRLALTRTYEHACDACTQSGMHFLASRYFKHAQETLAVRSHYGYSNSDVPRNTTTRVCELCRH